MTDKEKYINRKIKELQDNLKLSFKMTEEIIDISYRQAINDIKNFNTSNKESKNNIQNKPQTEEQSQKLNINTKIDYRKELEDYLKNKDDYEKFISIINEKIVNRYRRYNRTEEETASEMIKKIKLDIYKNIIDKIDKSRDLLTVYNYCRNEVEKINDNNIWT